MRFNNTVYVDFCPSESIGANEGWDNILVVAGCAFQATSKGDAAIQKMGKLRKTANNQKAMIPKIKEIIHSKELDIQSFCLVCHKHDIRSTGAENLLDEEGILLSKYMDGQEGLRSMVNRIEAKNGRKEKDLLTPLSIQLMSMKVCSYFFVRYGDLFDDNMNLITDRMPCYSKYGNECFDRAACQTKNIVSGRFSYPQKLQSEQITDSPHDPSGIILSDFIGYHCASMLNCSYWRNSTIFGAPENQASVPKYSERSREFIHWMLKNQYLMKMTTYMTVTAGFKGMLFDKIKNAQMTHGWKWFECESIRNEKL